MRIIGGKLKGIRLSPPSRLPVRPTTDVAKEALFNILGNMYHLSSIKVLDLFSGTGNVSLEFASRGAQVTSVDRDFGCFNYLKKTAKEFGLDNIQTVKSDVFKYLETEQSKYDLIFADPPYDLPQMNLLPAQIFVRELLLPGGHLIIEHPALRKLSNDVHFKDQRNYGSSAFSFFGK